MKTEDFEQLIIEAVEQLPEKIKKKIDNVVFLTEKEARKGRLKKQNIMRRQTLLGLYEGIPKTGRGEGYFFTLPDKITIFQKPIENICRGDPEKIKEMVYEVVWHEVGHHFGFSERGIRQLEQKKFRKNFK